MMIIVSAIGFSCAMAMAGYAGYAVSLNNQGRVVCAAISAIIMGLLASSTMIAWAIRK